MSFKTKEVVKMPEEMWTVVEAMHEPIITERTWWEVQKKLAVRKRCDNHGAIQMFAGLARCADCGYAMNYTYNKGEPRYQCSQYSVKGKSYCRSHYISYDDLQRLVIEDIRRMARYSASMTDGSLHRLEQEASKRSDAALQQKGKELRKLKARLEKLDAMTSSIYEDKVAGKVSETRCLRLMAKYEDEQRELRTSADELETEISAERQRRADTLEFVGINDYPTVENMCEIYKEISSLA